ncbi:hypothetical protein GCM10010430_70470 [Kitasatospora cystarginea]|uniref:Uncharacterized protein n=1 Tax=Kitasatospora cystarginea TaxID=58350 RepID=A0ABN3EW49_9ACTN
MNADQRPDPVERAEPLGQLPLPAERDLPPGRHALHRERLMRRIDLDTPATSHTRPRFRRRLVFMLAGALAAGAAVVGVTLYDRANSGPLSSAELSSWTSNPTPVDTSRGPGATTLKWCLDGMPGAGEPVTITNADLRGKVTSMVVARGGTVMLCYVASKNSGLSMSIGAVKPVAHDVITYDTGGSHGSGSATFNYAEGLVGADVKAVTMKDAGRTFEVTLDNGRWTAWWPGSDHDNGGVPDSVTLTLADGTTRTVTGDSLFPR